MCNYKKRSSALLEWHRKILSSGDSYDCIKNHLDMRVMLIQRFREYPEPRKSMLRAFLLLIYFENRFVVAITEQNILL